VVVDDEGVMINDTGRGIPDDEIDKVFRKHYRGAESAGAGIGLSLVKRICERQGWQIHMESAVGHGTSARLFFSLYEPDV
jgi:signal transduction histidine kinase